MMDFSSWLSDVNGRVIGDGQCVALAEDYITRVCSMSAVATPSGYAGSMWEAGPDSGFGQKSSDQTAMPGDLAVWGNAPFTPLTHVAPVIQDDGPTVKCMSQNPGPAHVMDIPKIGLKGYLTPGGGGSTVNVASVKTTGNVVTDTIDNVSHFIDTLSHFGNAIDWVSKPESWRRIGLFALGAILLYIAVAIILKDTGAAQWTTTTLANTRKTLATVQR